MRPGECRPGASPLLWGALARRDPPLLLRTFMHVKLLVVAYSVIRRTTRLSRLRASGRVLAGALLPLRGTVSRRDPPLVLRSLVLALSFCWCASAERETASFGGRFALCLFLPGERWTSTLRAFAVRYKSVPPTTRPCGCVCVCPVPLITGGGDASLCARVCRHTCVRVQWTRSSTGIR